MNTAQHRDSRLPPGLLFCALALIYSLWLVACWPGILGQDSLAIILEVESNRDFQSNKPPLWYLFNLALYGPWRLVEIPIACQMLICTLVCTRILSWMWTNRLYKSFFYGLLGVALAPSVLYYASSLYSDGIYAIALAGMLFEVWRCWRQRRLDMTACWMLTITVPFALFSRPNGILNVIAILALAIALPRGHRWRLAAVVLPWCVLAAFAHFEFKQRNPIGSVFPLALYETVGFLEHRPMGLWERGEPRVTAATVDALTSSGNSLEKILQFHDHYYWDPLIFFPQGPALLGLSKDAKNTILREFFTYNLWHNFPAFAASRINIFLYSSLADGGFAGSTNAEHILPQTHSNSEIRFRHGVIHRWQVDWLDFTFKYRAILWTPWVGLILMMLAGARTWRYRDRPGMVVCAIFWFQLLAVFTLSIAGEYRYLLAFFVAPLVLLPIFAASDSSSSNV